MLRSMFCALIVLHGLIHLLGFVRGFGLADVSLLRQSISRPHAVLWLAAAVAMIAAALVLVAAPQWFWIAGSVAVVLSQWVIVTAWTDAKFGTLANAMVLVGIGLSFAAEGPSSLRAQYRDALRAERLYQPVLPVVREEDLRALPEPVQKYVRLTGAVGQRQVHNVKVTWKGRIRASVSEAWMPFEAEQFNFYGPSPSRLFFMKATRAHLPLDIFHRFLGASATFRVRLLSMFTMVDAKGPAMDRGETVTLFDDLCILAPSMLIDPTITWEPIDARSARARFARGAETISAVLKFNDAGELVDFVSDDRSAASPDGKSFTPQRWSTPVRTYRAFGPRRVSTFGEARWEPVAEPGAAFTYAEFEMQGIEYDVGSS